MTDVDPPHENGDVVFPVPGRLLLPWPLAAAIAAAMLLIGGGFGAAFEGRKIDDATDAAVEAEAAAEAAEEAVTLAGDAIAQAEQNGRYSCLIADGIRVLIVSPGALGPSPPRRVGIALERLRQLDVECEANEDGPNRDGTGGS